jgi:A/G-specific adenine glycosylase
LAQAPYQKFFSSQLIHWYHVENKRTMPWKGEKDPYKIWLSEVILQQTRVAQGLQYYNRFIDQYPTVFALAEAKDEAVFKLWEGLGYYSRCKNLLHTAQTIAEHGKFPETYEELLKLKGVGPYTAAAIASFAYQLPHAVVDGNVYRVLSRFFGESVPIDSTHGKKFFNQLATKLLYQADPAAYNQAIMDFGATVCTPRQPACITCPLNARCSAFRRQMVDELPVKAKQLKRTTRWFNYFVLEHGNAVYIRQRTAGDIWHNLHEFYLLETSKVHHWTNAGIKKFLSNELGRVNLSVSSISESYKQQLTHQTIYTTFIKACTKQPLPEVGGFRYVACDKLDQLAFPIMMKRYLERHL